MCLIIIHNDPFYCSFSAGFMSVCVSQIQALILTFVFGERVFDHDFEYHWVVVCCMLINNSTIGLIWIFQNDQFKSFVKNKLASYFLK